MVTLKFIIVKKNATILTPTSFVGWKCVWPSCIADEPPWIGGHCDGGALWVLLNREPVGWLGDCENVEGLLLACNLRCALIDLFFNTFPQMGHCSLSAGISRTPVSRTRRNVLPSLWDIPSEPLDTPRLRPETELSSCEKKRKIWFFEWYCTFLKCKKSIDYR